MEASISPSSRAKNNMLKVVDKPGTFALLDKSQLRVDDSYQRKHSEQKIRKMANDWSWVACGTISVGLRGDGEWFVMDGQHRVLAALLRSDIKELPCLIFDTETVADEARGFLKSNTNRRPMTMLDRFKALLMTEDRHARIVNELASAAGRHLGGGSNGRAISAVQVMLTAIEQDEAALRRVWPILVELCAPDKKITQPLIQGMWYLERHLSSGESLSSRRWRERIVQVGYDAFNTAIENTAAYNGGGKGAKNCALGFEHAINRGLRNHLKHTINVVDTDEGK